MQTKDFAQNYPQENQLFLPEKAIARFGRGGVSDTAISPDSNLIAVASRIGVWLYEAHSEDFVRLFAVEGTGLLSAVTFSPDSTQIATGNWDGIATLWDVATGTEIVAFKNTDYVSSVAFSPDGTLLAAGTRNGNATLWDIDTGEARWTIPHNDSVSSVDFSQDGLLLATRISEGETDVRCVADGTSASLQDGRWTDGKIKDLPLTHPCSWYSWLVSFSPDGRHVVGMSELSAIKVWDIVSGKDIKTIDQDVGQAKSLTFSAEGNYIGLSRTENTVTLLIDEEQKAAFDHQTEVLSAAVSPSAMLAATGGIDREVKLWNIKTQEHLRTFSGHIGAVYVVTFSHDDTLLVSGGGRNFEIQEEDGFLYFISPEGSPIDQTAKVWEVGTGKEIATLEHPSLVREVTFSPDNTYLATTSENKVYLWDTKTWQKNVTLETVRVESFVFSPNGSLLAVGGRGKNANIQIWDVETAQLVVEFSGHKSDVESVAFSPDGTLLASGGYDGVIYLWDMMPYLIKT